MRSYSTRPENAGRYLLALLLLNLLYLLIMLPAMAALITTLAIAGDDGPALLVLAAWLAVIASGTYPLVALIAIVGGWARYARRRYPQALATALLPMLNLVLFGLAVGLAALLG